MSLNRRHMLVGLGAASGALAIGTPSFAQDSIKLVVIGGGFGGATAARTLKRLQPAASVTLIEPNTVFTACPFSNLVVGGQRELGAQQFGYDQLQRDGIKVVADTARDVDAVARTVTLNSEQILDYDRLIISPGIDIRWNAIPGYDRAAAQIMPHAWKAGPQTTLLRDQLQAIEDGGTVVMVVPRAPYRCPPGPYERASLIAHFLKTRKPRSKMIILDSKDTFSKMPLFQEAWAAHYPEHLEWRGASDDGRVSGVDPANRTVSTDFETISASAVNVIPPQTAGWIAERAGVADATGWCPIDATSFESTLQPGIHVIGDATIAAPMPKSAFSANLQAKICAIAVTRMMNDLAPEDTILSNTCYSYTTPDEAVSISGVYSNAQGTLTSVPGAGGLSPLGASPEIRRAEAAQAEAWFTTISQEAFG